MSSLLSTKTREYGKRKHKDEVDKQINECEVLEKRHRKALKHKEEREDEDSPQSGEEEDALNEAGKVPSKNITRRTFFGVIDNVSSFSGMIEGPYEFGFAISITVDRQTLKGVVFKKDDGKPSVSDDDMDLHNLAVVRASAHGKDHQHNHNHHHHKTSSTTSSSPSPPMSSQVPTPPTPTIPVQVPSPIQTHTPSSLSSSSSKMKMMETPKVEDEDEDRRLPDIRNITSFSHPHDYNYSFNANSLPNIQSMFQKMPRESDTNPKFDRPASSPSNHVMVRSSPPIPPSSQSTATLSPSLSSNSPNSSPPSHPPIAPLPPQPQLQRQKQRQKNRQEKRFLELAQHHPDKLKDLIHRENSKVPLLGDEKLINKGMDIMQQMKVLNTNYVR